MKKRLSAVLISLALAAVSVNAAEQSISTKYNPFEEMIKMQKEIDSIFDKYHKSMMREDMYSAFSSTFPTAPAVDLKDDGDKYLLKANIPGSKNNEIQVTTNNNMLKIEAKSSESKEEKKSGFLKKERFAGTYVRMMSLPEDADMDKLKSEYKDGVLTVTIGKKK